MYVSAHIIHTMVVQESITLQYRLYCDTNKNTSYLQNIDKVDRRQEC
jgi:hypothetical protein